MPKHPILQSFLFIVIILFSFKGFSQLSKKHYIPPLTSAAFGNANVEDQHIYLSTPNNSNIPYTIIPVGQPTTSYITGTVTNAIPQQITIGTGNGQLFIPSTQTSVVTNDRGYIIEADAPIYVSVRMNAGGGAQAGALVSKGVSALGTTFRVGSYTNGNPQNNYLNFVSVMATEDNTVVNFSNLPSGLIIKNYTGATPINVTLNEGESYTIATNSDDTTANQDGLIGCLVNSDKPIVVNCGSANGSFGTGNGRDYGIDQIVDLSKVGTEYIFVRGDGNDAWENILLVPHTAGTTFSINGGAPTPISFPYEIIEGNQYNSNGNLYVETSQPVFAYQGVGGLGNNGSSSEANQGLFFVPPLSCETRGNLDNIANINNIGNTNYQGGISIVTKVGATITINNNPITVAPNTVDGKPDYITYKVKGLNGNISVQSDDELYCAYFNYNGDATSGSFYSGFPSAPEINFDAQFATLGNCIPNITLEAANTQNFDSFKWLFDDGSGSGFIDLLITTAEITPTQPGKYKLIGIITCTGEELESIEIPISICPDDRDNDGIIDNIDIDNDNDGILNCTESKGNAALNTSVLSNPELIFQDSTRDNTIASGNYTQSNDLGNTNIFSGNSSGGFSSILSNASNAENMYAITFTEPVNVKFEETISLPNTNIADEFFIARILPVNKNITLIDPDDHLLVDSNFDGIFEAGVTQISGSEIHFRINPSPSGNTPYSFLANQVDGFTFVHKLENGTTSSIFTGGLTITCFKNDNDLDGIKDAFDLDSDNDGIPDIVENQGTLVTLSGIDADLNGLDDIFNISDLPIDTDNDTVLDFYDLDSDNDGISDLIETGQLGTLSDTNLDGVVDAPNFGVNGWADAAQTSPDSNEIGYTLNDLDNDAIFTYLDSDSDGDGCSDVIEAGFSDGNQDDFLGNSTPSVDLNGLVNNASDGYIIPNIDYLTTAPISITTQPVNTIACELSTASLSVVSPETETYQWKLSTNGANWTNIADNATYSGAQTADLTISMVPITFNGYLYRVKLDRAGNSCGIYSDEIDLTVDQLPVANTASVMRICDDDNNGTMPFDLTTQDNSITNVSGMTITYHISQADAYGNIDAITSPFESGSKTIYVRVENDNNTSCFATSNFNIEVFDSAFPTDSTTMTRLQECDNNSVGNDTDGFITLDLTQKETEILNGQSDSDFTITYFYDASYTNQITTPTAFDNTVSGLQTIYVRVTNNQFTNCYTDTSFEIEVFELPQANNPSTYSQCDDASNDGQALFNLTLDSIKEEINTNFIAQGLVFTYYETQTEAENAANAITNPDAYQDALGFTIETVWVRIENPNTCFRVVPLNLEVNPSSAALASYMPAPKFECDDGADNRDGIAVFNMTDIRNYISANIFPTFNVSVHFYESQTDAELETNEILDITNHENTNSPNIQSIWVRVKSDLGNDCLGLEEFPNLLNVEALPTANPVTIARACDFDTTDAILSFPFDVSQLEADVLNGQNPLNVTITYFDSNGAPLLYADGTTVTSPIQPTFLTENQTITITITNNSTQDPDGACYDETTLEFIVDEQPITNPIPTQIVCDGDVGDVSDDGFYPFDTSAFTSTILGTQAGMEIYYDYVDENGNLITDSTTLPNPLISENQTISVEVINPINTSCTATTSIQFIINPIPEFTLDEEILVCNSPFVPFDLIPIQANASEVFVYQWTFEDGTILGNNLILEDISQPGEYTITLTNPITLCVESRTINIRAADVANITLEDIDIDDLSENNTVTILNPSALGNSTYMFSLISSDTGGVTFPYQESPIFNNVRAGFYTLLVQDNDATCDPVELSIAVIGHPRFFTPNGDGYNDFWQIKGISTTNQTNSTVLIYDRYGKLIKQVRPSELGWDGTFNQAIMPTDDYWFKVHLEDGRTFMGHFTLKR